MLLQAFDWEMPEGAALDLTEKFGIVMKKATPLVAVPTYAEAFQTRSSSTPHGRSVVNFVCWGRR
jgi:hypothetical protein